MPSPHKRTDSAPPAAADILDPQDRVDAYLPCRSSQMHALAAIVARVASTHAAVLICGETGVGKTALARLIHAESRVRDAPILIAHGATMTPAWLDLHAAHRPRVLLLEEVGELAPLAQDALVRLLETRAHATPLRVICTTSRDLSAQHLRSDLVYRIDVVRLDIPALRHRPEDIVFLAEHFLALAARHFGTAIRRLSSGAQSALLEYDWPGNVRELRNCIFESSVNGSGAMLRSADLRLRSAGMLRYEPGLEAALEHLHAHGERDLYDRVQQGLLHWALDTCGGNMVKAAALLGIGRGALRSKLQRYRRA